MNIQYETYELVTEERVVTATENDLVDMFIMILIEYPLGCIIKDEIFGFLREPILGERGTRLITLCVCDSVIDVN